MKLRNTIILAAIAAMLAGWYFLVEQPRKRRADLREAAESDLAAFRMDEVSFVTIARPGETLRFERKTRGWVMTEPLVDKAADGSVNQLLGALSDAEIFRNLGPQGDLSTFGLAPPAATVTARTAAGDTAVALDIGELTVDKYYVYARRKTPDAPVLLVPTGVRRYALAGLSDFRNDRLVSFGLSTVESFTLRWPLRSMTWRRDGPDRWVTDHGGYTVKGRREYVEAVVRFVQGARVSEFVPGDQIDVVAPFTQSDRSVEISISDGSSRLVRFGRRMEQRLYAGAYFRGADGENTGRVALIDTTVLQIFDSTLDNMREKRLMRFDPAGARKLEVTAPEFQLTLVRPGREWGFPNPSVGRVDQGAVRDVLDAAAELEFWIVLEEDAARAAAYGLSEPEIRVTIQDDTGGTMADLSLVRSPEHPGVYVATSRFSGVVATVQEAKVDELVAELENLLEPAGGSDG